MNQDPAAKDSHAGVEASLAKDEVEIVSLSSEGDGVGRLADGRVVFVRGSAPGDRVLLTAVEEGKRFVRAAVRERVRSSGDRVEARCSHFEACGGCQWQHIAYPAQVEAKQTIVRDALERIGRIALTELPEITPSPEPYAYRARARWVETEGGLGYRARGSRDVQSVDACPVLVPAAEQALKSRSAARAAEAEARGDGVRRRRSREWITTASGASINDQAVISGPRTRGAPPSVEIEVAGLRLRVGNTSFVQANALLWDPLIEAVCEAALGSRGGETASASPSFAELYCGIGFFTLPLVAAGARGVALESDRAALSHLAFNLRRAGLADRVEVLRGRAEERGDLAHRFAGVDFVLVDPPRTGLAAPVRRALIESGVERIVYLSCDPGTLARDLAELTAAGHRLVSLRLFDLFPQTSHVESLVVLEKR